MDAAVLVKLLEALGPGGLVAVLVLPSSLWSVLVLVLWYASARKTDRLLVEYRADTQETLKQYRADTQEILKQYREHHLEVQRMYENNAELVRVQQRQTAAMESLIVKNIEGLTKMTDMVGTNQFCPYVRLEKAAHGPQS